MFAIGDAARTTRQLYGTQFYYPLAQVPDGCATLVAVDVDRGEDQRGPVERGGPAATGIARGNRRSSAVRSPDIGTNRRRDAGPATVLVRPVRDFRRPCASAGVRRNLWRAGEPDSPKSAGDRRTHGAGCDLGRSGTPGPSSEFQHDRSWRGFRLGAIVGGGAGLARDRCGATAGTARHVHFGSVGACCGRVGCEPSARAASQPH